MPLIFVRYVLETKLRKSPSKPDALTNLSRRGSVLEIDGRHVGTRTPDLYRVNEFKNGKSGTCKPYSGRSVAFRTVGNTNCSQIVPTRRIGNAPPDHYRNAVVSTALECPNLPPLPQERPKQHSTHTPACFAYNRRKRLNCQG